MLLMCHLLTFPTLETLWKKIYTCTQKYQEKIQWIICEHNSSKCRVGNSLIGISRDSLIFCERKTKRLICWWKIVVCSSRSFVMSDRCKSLMVALCKQQWEQITHIALLFKATWVICSGLLFKKEKLSEEQWEPFALWHKKGKKR